MKMKPSVLEVATAGYVPVLVVLSLSVLLLVSPLASPLSAQNFIYHGGDSDPRNFDDRPRDLSPVAPSPQQLSALDSLRGRLPAAAATFDPYTGATRTLYNPAGTLTGPQEGDAQDLALAFVKGNRSLLGLGPADLREWEVTDSVVSSVTGVTHLYLRQLHAGLPVYNAQLQVNITADGRILSVNNAFVPELGQRTAKVAPGLGAQNAVMRAAQHLGIQLPGQPLAVLETSPGPEQRTVVAGNGLSLEPIEAELMWLPLGRDVELVWNFQIQTLEEDHWLDINVSATTGNVRTRFDWTSDAEYRVYAQPTESPIHTTPLPPADARTLEVNPHLSATNASPLGWHDTGSTAFTITRGNNVHAYEDRDANNAPPATEVDCGDGLSCDFPIDLTQPPSAYIEASITNLFYWNNIIHDVQYQYGFDEAAGNFQVNNFGNGGAGGDDVRAEGQDGIGNCNANFGTPTDGNRPRMQMFTCSNTNPPRDGDLDAGVITHEYGHGISNRQVGGPNNVSCLNNTQQPGEGWSDWLALAYTAEVGDQGTDPRGVGSYLFGLAPTGTIRPQQYSTDPAINNYTYESIGGLSVPHGVGSVWAQAIWEVYWALVDTHGFDPDIYNATGGAGNQRAMLYVNEGFKNTACSPTFLDTRDGIIQAAASLFGGEDVCLLWQTFAAFGLGSDAATGGPSTRSATNGFQIPSGVCTGCTNPPAAPTGLVATTPVDFTIALSWNAVTGATSYKVLRSTTSGGPYTLIATVTTTSFTDTPLPAGEEFFYVVQASDDTQTMCMSGNSNEASAVVTGAPPPCTPGTVLYSNDFEGQSGLSDWTRGTFDGSSTADWQGVQSCDASSGTNIFRFGGSNCNNKHGSDDFIFAQPNGVSGISVPAGSETTRLFFDHRYRFETGFDGGTLTLSLDGIDYTVVPSGAITGANYDGNIANGCEPAGTAGVPVYTGTQDPFVSTTVDLDAVCDLITGGTAGCAGQTLFLGFTGISDCRRNERGWFLDDVTVTACVP